MRDRSAISCNGSRPMRELVRNALSTFARVEGVMLSSKAVMPVCDAISSTFRRTVPSRQPSLKGGVISVLLSHRKRLASGVLGVWTTVESTGFTVGFHGLLAAMQK